LLDEAGKAGDDGKYVVLTFDDGLEGNIKYALPLLRAYGFRATFFITVNFVGTPRFMGWEDLECLVREGMSVQSHTLSHRHLNTLSEEDIAYELHESKRHLEQRLGNEVHSLSFPHGSYDPRTVRLAGESGYRFLCTSEVQRMYRRSFSAQPAVVGRLAITNRMRTGQLLKWLEYDSMQMLKTRLSKDAKNLLKRVIGANNYGRLYRYFFSIKKQHTPLR